MLSSGAADAKRVLDGEQARYYQPVLWDGMLPTTLCQVFTSELAAIRHALKVVANAGVSGYRITTVELTKKEAGV